LGPRVDMWKIPFLGRLARPTNVETSPAGRWSHWIQGRPWPAAIIATLILLLLAAPALGMRLGFPDAGNDAPDTMTRQAYDLIAEGFGPGANGPLVVVAEQPDADSKAAIAGLATKLKSEPGVSYVAKTVQSDDGSAALITVIPKTSPQDEATT